MRVVHMCALIAFMFVSVASAQEMPGAQVRMQAPDFEAKDFRGKEIRLSKLYQEGPVILVFYRGNWCPYCNAQLQQLQSRLKDFKKYDASLVAVSVDKIDKSAEAAEGYDLEFDIISDPEGDIIGAYNLVYHVPDELSKEYKEKYGIDLEGASGRADHMIAIPATYIIDAAGTIVFAYANEDYKIRTSPEEIIQELEKLRSK